LRAFDTDFSQGLESYLSYSRKILAGNFHEEAVRSYSQKIVVRSSRDVAEHTTLESFEEQKHEKEVETEKEETVNILVQFSRIIKDS
jgi:hypothetical protein